MTAEGSLPLAGEPHQPMEIRKSNALGNDNLPKSNNDSSHGVRYPITGLGFNLYILLRMPRTSGSEEAYIPGVQHDR